MNTINSYIKCSFKKMFTYRTNGIMVIIDSILDCISVWVFWNSLYTSKIEIYGWSRDSIGIFISISLISMSISNFFVGVGNICEYIIYGGIEKYFLLPFNSIVIILLEKCNFLRILINMVTGVALLIMYSSCRNLEIILFALFISLLGTLTIRLIEIIIAESSFFIKGTSNMLSIVKSIFSVSKYPIKSVYTKVEVFFTAIIPISFVATIPTDIISNRRLPYFSFYIILLFLLVLFITNILWKKGVKKYEQFS